ncbi:solute carrier family 23 protein [Paenibacillus profundus]|nr:solute carrier family 23 protein [Paenibacillus profundus]
MIGEGISCLIASLLGSTPVTGYSINAGIISITGIAAAASSLP